jgi:hypothetical protein
MKGKPFFVELYNLHLSGQIPPTPEEKRKLTETILTNHKLSYLIIASERKGFYTFHQESEPTITQDLGGMGLPTNRGVYFYIGQIEETNHFQVGYCSSTLDWWKEDYPAFLKEYTHLRSFVDGYLKGTFHQSDQMWLRKALQLFTLEPIYGGKLSDSTFEFKDETGRIKQITIGIVPNTSQIMADFSGAPLSANEIILLPIYSELIELIVTKPTIKRCQAPKTLKTHACQNIFLPYQKGKEQLYCSQKCANRVRRREYYRKRRK